MVAAVRRRYLAARDYVDAETIFAESQTEVPYDDPAWDDEGRWELGPGVALELDDDDDLEEYDFDEEGNRIARNQLMTLAPVRRLSDLEWARRNAERID